MAKPTDLTSKTWNKVKGLTVPKTGFGEKLDAYQAAKRKTEDLPTRNLKAFDTAAKALGDITKHIPVAQQKCNKTLHKDTIEALGAYKALVDKEGGELHSAAVKYQGYIDKYKDLRAVCGQELAAIETRMDNAAKKVVADAKREIAAGHLAEAGKQIKAGTAQLQQIQQEANDSLQKPRVPGPAVETPHADDRPDASVFTALINKQQDIIAVRTEAEHELATLLKDAVAKAKT